MKSKIFVILLFLLSALFTNAQDFKILYVNDDNNGADEDGPIVTALNNLGIDYVRINGYDSVPSYAFAQHYDLILWYTGNDGVTDLWDSDNTFKDVLEQFEANAGVVWVDGLDWIYDIYGTAPDNFAPGDFIYDKLGISKYLSQSYVDDGNNGVPQYDTVENPITRVNPIKWVYSSLYYADGLEILPSAVALYKMYDDPSYPLAGQITALYHQYGTGVYLSSGFRLGKMDTQENIDSLMNQILMYAKYHWDNEAVSIEPTDAQTITVNTDGNPLTANLTVGWDSLEWKYSLVSGGPYQSFSPKETAKTYTPNFSTPGTYYVVCVGYYGGQEVVSNEVQINVVNYQVSITPEDPQFLLTGQNGTTLTVSETPTADSREWKYSTTSGGPYQSFSPAETGTTFTPNFSEKGIYYVVCVSNFSGTEITSNEVKIIVDTNSSNYYLSFDGDDSFYIRDDNQDYINVSDNWTFETWVKVDDYQAGTYPVIMDRAECFSMYVQADDSDDFSIAFVKRDANDNIVASLSSYNVPEITFKFHQWYHIAATYDGIKARLFVNGIEVDSTTDDFTLLPAATDYINIGCRYRSGYQRYLTGALENIRMSKKARYTSDFTPDFYSPLISDTNDVFCLNLENNGKTSLFDFSGHFSNINLRNPPNNPDWEYKFYNEIQPADVQNIVQNQDGNTLRVFENGLASSREWKYATTSGGPYQSFSPAQTDTIYTPNFANPGTYYVVCQSDFNGNIITSNEVQINVSEVATITTGSIDGSPFYVSNIDSAAVSVPYSITGTFNSDNVFIAYLSDANGDFTNAIPIGQIASTSSGTINAYIPANTPSGTGYRIMVKSTSPVVEGSDNGSDLQIILLQNSISPTDTQFIDINQNGNPLTVNDNYTADSHEWKYATTSGGPYQSFNPAETGDTYTPNFADTGTYYVVCESYFNGNTITARSNEVMIKVETPYKILLVNDDNNGADETGAVETALQNTGYTYYKVNIEDSIPSYAFLQRFDLVIWYTGNDLNDLGIWDTAQNAFINAVQQYVDNDGVLWLDGLNWLYEIYGSAPDNFSEGEFVYDVLGINSYLSQTYYDDGNLGVSYYDKTPQNYIFTENPVKWQYSTLWSADGLALNDNTVPLYTFGGDASYPLLGQINSFYKQKNYGTYLITQFRLGRLGDGSNFVQDSVNKVVNDVINYTQQTPALYCGEVSDTVIYITNNQDVIIKVPYHINGGFDFNENNVFTAYLSDENGDFANEIQIGSLQFFASDTIIATIPGNTPSGTHYRIRVKSSDPNLISDDNGKDITIINVQVAISPADTQNITVGQPGTMLTVSENPTADSREWKYATTSGGPYQSFDPAETGTTYTPLFNTQGTYYIVCQSVIGGNTYTSNEVVINVNPALEIGEIEGSPFTVTTTQGAAVSVPYTALGSFADDNVFTAYLSDSLGNFDNEIAIGSLDTNVSDTILAEIPANTPSGTHYRIRVKSSNPELVSQDNGQDLIIILDTTTAIQFIDNQLVIYPNPTVNNIKTNSLKPFDYQIFDVQGTVIQQGENVNIIDVSGLKSGVYFIKINTGKTAKTFRVIKM